MESLAVLEFYMKAGSILTNPQNFCQTRCHFQGMLTKQQPTCPSPITRSDCPKAGRFHGRLHPRPASQGGFSLQCLPFRLRDTFTSTNDQPTEGSHSTLPEAATFFPKVS